ncbi:hypothetical protein CAEBREN_22834 [Caenorhabditis brenneri]|uniref:Uncharacterized protein n=1 Tax=Caenorhabditis brenneri TaxID=135651 RepID=G0P611_CAEBE|nr:hypothetical protein CAEBREN_22834 [Caenorhabditis brenneri]
MKLFFLLLLALLTAPVHGESRHKRQASPGVPPKSLLQATMNHFSAAIATRNKSLLLKVFNWPNPNEARINAAFEQFSGTSYVVKSASYMGTKRIEGFVQATITTARGTNVTTKRVVMRHAPESPTNWKIFSVSGFDVGK